MKEDYIISVGTRTDIFTQFSARAVDLWGFSNLGTLNALFCDKADRSTRVVSCDVIADILNILFRKRRYGKSHQAGILTFNARYLASNRSNTLSAGCPQPLASPAVTAERKASK